MDKNQIQKPITGLFLVILLLVSCQPQIDCGLKCGIGMSLEEEKICVLLDTSLFKKPYSRYIDLPKLHDHRRVTVLSELDVRSENKSDLFNFRYGYDLFKDTGDVYLIMYNMKIYYEYFIEYGPVWKHNDLVSTYMICDTFYGGYIKYDYNYYFDEFNHRVGWVDVSYIRKETEERSLSVGMKLSDNMFRSGDSLRAIQLIKSIELLKGGCQKKCLCFPD